VNKEMEKVTVYIPEEMKIFLEERKVPMSQFCRSALNSYISLLKGHKRWRELHSEDLREYDREHYRKSYEKHCLDPIWRRRKHEVQRKLGEKKKAFGVLWELNNFII
jgi:hypothetical protein